MYVDGAALVSGHAADILNRILSAPLVAKPLDRLSDPEVEAMREAIRRAAKAYAQAGPDERNDETSDDPTGPQWGEEISTDEAARVLGVSRRRAQQLAEGGMGRRVAGRWRLDSLAVLAYRDERRRCA
ncbi:hypothetical protein [Streptosporangium sp. NPDC006930]|uniref:hypothetical protein n=1 Tax=Streptosporangium sp. NPDC006930 TaxID=3154783 RepID=UPI003446E900